MSENNSIWDNAGEPIGVFKGGICWGRPPRERIGEYTETSIYDNTGTVVATFDGQSVTKPDGSILGLVQGDKIVVGGNVVGTFIGTASSGAAGLALLFSGLELPPYNNAFNGQRVEDNARR